VIKLKNYKASIEVYNLFLIWNQGKHIIASNSISLFFIPGGETKEFKYPALNKNVTMLTLKVRMP